MKKILGILFTFCMTIGMGSIFSVTVFAGNMTKTSHICDFENKNGICDCGAYEPAVLNNGIYEISNAGQLYWFGEKVNGGESTLNAVLLHNIDLENRSWVSIGNEISPYCGVFDGAGKEIKNLAVNAAADDTGLFGYLDSAILKNLLVRGEVVNTASKTGGIVGFAKNSIISGCINYASIKGSGNLNGGIGGSVENTNISDCINYGEITLGVYQNGGIVGTMNGGMIERCMNKGNISVKDHAGGIVGWLEAGTVQNCGNTAKVSNTNSHYTYVGGIAGECRGTVQNCFNTGTVIGVSGFGCFQGAVVAHYDAGGIGSNNYTNQSYGDGDSGAVKSNAEFVSGEVAWLLNGENADGVWRQILTGSSAQTEPGFNGDKVYKNVNGVFSNTCDHVNSTAKPTHTDSAVCSECGETIDAIGHSYGTDWKFDEYNHWHECSCGDRVEGAAHNFEWIVDKAATATEKGNKHEECTVCGYKKAAVEIPATGTANDPTKPGEQNGPIKQEGETKNPQTDDVSNLVLWFALTLITCMGLTAAVAYGKKEKEQAK